MARTLQLLSASYDQRVSDDPVRYKRRTRGEVFEAHDEVEYERLTSIGAALDPEKAQEREAARLDQERAALEARKEALDAEIASLSSDLPPDPANLKGADLDAALEAAGLSTEGKADEKRQRLAEHQTAAG